MLGDIVPRGEDIDTGYVNFGKDNESSVLFDPDFLSIPFVLL